LNGGGNKAFIDSLITIVVNTVTGRIITDGLTGLTHIYKPTGDTPTSAHRPTCSNTTFDGIAGGCLIEPPIAILIN
jgi:hypothetical protein